jgi:hypothetical protein
MQQFIVHQPCTSPGAPSKAPSEAATFYAENVAARAKATLCHRQYYTIYLSVQLDKR